jgi:hypothetical protein
MFSLQQNRRRGQKKVLPRSRGKGNGRREDMAQTMYTHVGKCKSDKIKERKKKRSVND